MKRVLVITDLGHATPRIPGLATYMPDKGWEADILTPRMTREQREIFIPECAAGLKIVGTENYDMRYGCRSNRPLSIRLIRRMVRMLGLDRTLPTWGDFPDEHRDWYPYAYGAIKRLIQSKSYNVLLSSSSPVTSHLIAQAACREWQIPWVADLRDLWSQNHCYRYGESRRACEEQLEKRTLRDAADLITVSRPCAASLGALHRRKVRTITNGFFPNADVSPPASELPAGFLVLYTGRIYETGQDFRKFISAFVDWRTTREHGGDIHFIYVGPDREQVEQWVLGWIGEEAAKRWCHIWEGVSRSEALSLQSKADALLVLNWEDPKEPGVAPTKLYEYIGAGRPILATGGHGGDVVEDILQRTGAGSYCRKHCEIINGLEEIWQRRDEERRKPRVAESASEYAYPTLSGKLCDILDNVG